MQFKIMKYVKKQENITSFKDKNLSEEAKNYISLKSRW